MPVIVLLIASLLLICVRISVAAGSGTDVLKVGFLCVGSISDWGFNYAHNQGRLYLEKTLAGHVETVIAERIPESAEAERVLERMISQGCRLIFTTSYGYMEPMVRVAARHPEVTFMQINRDCTGSNIGTYYSNLYQPDYLTGIVAGRMTKTNHVGFVAARAVPPLMQAVNAFTLGTRSVNKKADVRVVWINSWADAPLEAEAVRALAEGGCDVVANAQDSQTTITRSCKSLGIYCCGFYTDASQLAPKNWLTGARLDWGPFYSRIAQSVINHTWKPVCYKQGMDADYIKLSSFGTSVPDSVCKEVLAKEELLKKGKLSIFAGPLKDREGHIRLPAGEKSDLQWLSNMDFFVPGVTGALPKG